MSDASPDQSVPDPSVTPTRTFIICTPGSGLSDATKALMAKTYDEMAAANRMMGFVDLAYHCERNASAARFGGVLQLEPPDGMP